MSPCFKIDGAVNMSIHPLLNSEVNFVTMEHKIRLKLSEYGQSRYPIVTLCGSTKFKENCPATATCASR